MSPPAPNATFTVSADPTVGAAAPFADGALEKPAHHTGTQSQTRHISQPAQLSVARHQDRSERASPVIMPGNAPATRYEAIHDRINAAAPSAAGSQDIDTGDGNSSISGKVLDQSGQPMSGVAVSASVRRFFGASGEDSETPQMESHANIYKYKTVSRDDGSFFFADLMDGEYQLKARHKPYLPASTTIRTGVKDVNLVLAKPHVRYVRGTITNQSGQTLTGVKVLPNLPSAGISESNDEGFFEAELPLLENTAPDSLFVRFTLEGYRDQLIRIVKDDWDDLNQASFDITMAPVNDVVAVAGIVRSTSGIPLPGETVTLHSGSLRNRYSAITDSSGSFLIQNIDLGDDYSITLRPRGIYKDYTYSPFPIRADVLNLDIQLEPLETTVLNGQLMDTNGEPIPGFTLQLRSAQATGHVIEVRSDYQGHFQVNNVPRDSLIFETWSSPQFRISNIKQPDNYDSLPVILDWGKHEIQGRVQNSRGEPVPASRVHLTWTHSYNGIRSVATRRTVTDATGHFRFSQVGPGEHMLSVDAPGFQTSRRTYETVTTENHEVLIRLQSKLL
jgi:protocatechuate 3,4-dioxygenase beta subunit